MSKHNKVNKSNYDQGGRLTPDDMARERQKMMHPATPSRREQVMNWAPSPQRRGAPESSRSRNEPEESE